MMHNPEHPFPETAAERAERVTAASTEAWYASRHEGDNCSECARRRVTVAIRDFRGTPWNFCVICLDALADRYIRHGAPIGDFSTFVRVID